MDVDGVKDETGSPKLYLSEPFFPLLRKQKMYYTYYTTSVWLQGPAAHPSRREDGRRTLAQSQPEGPPPTLGADVSMPITHAILYVYSCMVGCMIRYKVMGGGSLGSIPCVDQPRMDHRRGVDGGRDVATLRVISLLLNSRSYIVDQNEDSNPPFRVGMDASNSSQGNAARARSL